MRRAAVAGSFYPANAIELKQMVDSLVNNSPTFEVEGTLKIAVVPHAGYIFSGLVAAAVYKVIKHHQEDFDNIILMGPSHYVIKQGTYAPQDTLWEFPWGIEKVNVLEDFPQDKEVHEREHSLEVQIPFLHYLNIKKPVYPLAVSQDIFSNLANRLLPYMDNSLLIISTDLSHYHPYEEAIKIDQYANTCIPEKNIACVLNHVEACGKLPLLAALEIANLKQYTGEFLLYMNSGDVWWDKERVVGYGGYVFTE